MQQGEIPVGNNTSMGGLATVTSALSIVQKAASLRWDDNITRPLIEGLYHYNMQYNEDNGIKANMKVAIGGATERIDAQMRSQDIERILGLAGTNPDYGDEIDPHKAFRELVANSRAGDILRPKQESEERRKQREQMEQQQAQSNPDEMKAQASMLTAQTQQQEAQHRMQLSQLKMQQEEQRHQQELMVRQQEIEARNAAQMVELQNANQDYQLKLAQMADSKEITIAELQTRLQINSEEQATKRQKIMADLEKQNKEINIKHQYGEGL
jgi:hypothetical protein